MIIGLSGYARSGKDEAAKVMVEEFGFTRVAFADKLRESLYELNPIVKILRSWDGKTEGYRNVYLQEVIDEFGWDGYKETPFGSEIRRLLQRLGTEAGRNVLGQNVWVNAALGTKLEDRHYKPKIVVTDCRFPNEAQAIVDRGGEIWRVTRWGIKKANDHPSETSLDDWPFDRIIINDSTLESYQMKIRMMCKNENRL